MFKPILNDYGDGSYGDMHGDNFCCTYELPIGDDYGYAIGVGSMTGNNIWSWERSHGNGGIDV